LALARLGSKWTSGGKELNIWVVGDAVRVSTAKIYLLENTHLRSPGIEKEMN
jgi:hypothetical protein